MNIIISYFITPRPIVKQIRKSKEIRNASCRHRPGPGPGWAARQRDPSGKGWKVEISKGGKIRIPCCTYEIVLFPLGAKYTQAKKG